MQCMYCVSMYAGLNGESHILSGLILIMCGQLYGQKLGIVNNIIISPLIDFPLSSAAEKDTVQSDESCVATVLFYTDNKNL